MHVSGRRRDACAGRGQIFVGGLERLARDGPGLWRRLTSFLGLQLLGAKLAEPDSHVFAVCGDGGFQMNIQELGTASQYRLPVKIFILNNEYMGMVRQWQELTYESRYSNSYSDSLPDFVKLAEAYGWKGIRIEDESQLDAGIEAMLAHDGPVMVDCQVAKEANCFPMIPSGAAHTDMLLDPNQIAGIMSDEAKALV
mgnify:CR=1 FL=1